MIKALVLLSWSAAVFSAFCQNRLPQPELPKAQPSCRSGEICISGPDSAALGVAPAPIPSGSFMFGPGQSGGRCDDKADDTFAFNALIGKVASAGGGQIVVLGTCLLASGEIVMPNSGGNMPTQASIRITGVGSSANGYWTALPNSPSALDLQFNAPVAKIETHGAGLLEIDHLNLIDNGSDCAPFILSTNTTISGPRYGVQRYECAFGRV